jgi:hypothetical protein
MLQSNGRDGVIMRVLKCDCCNRDQHEVEFNQESRRYFWRRFFYDSQGGSYTKLDICDGCFKAVGKAVKEQSNE